MKIQLFGFYGMKKLGFLASRLLGTDEIPECYDKSYLKDAQVTAWHAIANSGSSESVVDVVLSETQGWNNQAAPYAVVTYEEGVETPDQILSVISELKKIGLDVEEPKPIRFYSSRNLESTE